MYLHISPRHEKATPKLTKERLPRTTPGSTPWSTTPRVCVAYPRKAFSAKACVNKGNPEFGGSKTAPLPKPAMTSQTDLYFPGKCIFLNNRRPRLSPFRCRTRRRLSLDHWSASHPLDPYPSTVIILFVSLSICPPDYVLHAMISTCYSKPIPPPRLLSWFFFLRKERV